jgi:hypothetical protein
MKTKNDRLPRQARDQTHTRSKIEPQDRFVQVSAQDVMVNFQECWCEKRIKDIFCNAIDIKSDHFTKTGSGQT